MLVGGAGGRPGRIGLGDTGRRTVAGGTGGRNDLNMGMSGSMVMSIRLKLKNLLAMWCLSGLQGQKKKVTVYITLGRIHFVIG